MHLPIPRHRGCGGCGGRAGGGGRRRQTLAWGAGLAIFFDDYSSILIVGPTLRPLADACGVSREKLTFLVDSTAAPVAAAARSASARPPPPAAASLRGISSSLTVSSAATGDVVHRV